MKKIHIAIIVVLVSASSVSAEVFHMKDGTKIKGKIVEQKGYGVVVDVQGKSQTLLNKNIEKMTRDEDELIFEVGRIKINKSMIPDVADIKIDLITELMEVNGTYMMMRKNLDEVIAQAPDDQKDFLNQIFDTNEIVTRLIPLYSQQYDMNDLKQLITFYKSPIGQKTLKVTPLLMESVIRETIKYFQEKVQYYQGQ